MTIDHEYIKALSKKLRRPAKTLCALSVHNDPFYITPGRQRDAEWFAEWWQRLGAGKGMHLRRMHYQLVSQDPPVVMPAGDADDTRYRQIAEPYVNSSKCFGFLITAAGAARYLELVPPEDFEDRRNPANAIGLVPSDDNNGGIWTADDNGPAITALTSDTAMPDLPTMYFTAPKISQRYHIELWCEKSTMDDILMPLKDEYRLNVITGMGEMSQTKCVEFVERAIASGRPVRILYIADFDPAGIAMCVNVARKVEFRLHQIGKLDLDIQVRPIALTQEQCEEYELPRIPNSEDDRRTKGFEQRFGNGRTELDALEALRPGALREIIVGEIERYYDTGLQSEVDEAAREIEQLVDDANEEAHDEHSDDIERLEESWRELTEEHNRRIQEWQESARPVWDAIAASLAGKEPYLEEWEWPRPDNGDEDEDPLFDSSRDYVAQVDRYKAYVRKPTKRKTFSTICPACGTSFEALTHTSKFCRKCQEDRHKEQMRKNNRTCYARKKARAGLA
jgi:hypothetical protein